MYILQHLDQRMDSDFLSQKSRLLCYKYGLSTGRLTVECPVNPISTNVRDSGINFPLEHALAEVAKANKILELLHRTSKINQNKLFFFKTHITPVSEYCSLSYSSMRQWDRTAAENVQRVFLKRIVDI